MRAMRVREQLTAAAERDRSLGHASAQAVGRPSEVRSTQRSHFWTRPNVPSHSNVGTPKGHAMRQYRQPMHRSGS